MPVYYILYVYEKSERELNSKSVSEIYKLLYSLSSSFSILWTFFQTKWNNIWNSQNQHLIIFEDNFRVVRKNWYINWFVPTFSWFQNRIHIYYSILYFGPYFQNIIWTFILFIIEPCGWVLFPDNILCTSLSATCFCFNSLFKKSIRSDGFKCLIQTTIGLVRLMAYFAQPSKLTGKQFNWLQSVLIDADRFVRQTA